MRLNLFAEYFKHKLLLVFLAGILLRIIVMPIYFNSDVLAQAQWAKWLGEHGTRDFYDQKVEFIERPNYPPFMNMWYLFIPSIQGTSSLFLTDIGLFIALHKLGANHLLWYYDFVKWFGSDTFKETNLRFGFLMLVKLLPVVADLLMGWVVYFFAKRLNPKHALFYSGLYLLFPFSLYVSAYWGQTDPISALFIFLGFLMLHKKRFILSSFFLLLSLNIKPTVLLLTPLFIFYYLYLRPTFKTIVASLFISIMLFLASVSFFTNSNPIFYTQKLFNIFFFTKPPYLNVSAFNLWFIFSGFSKIPDTVTYFLISARTWGLLIVGRLNLIAFNLIRQKTIKSVFTAMFIAGFGSWLFLTNMYERYLFNGILALFFLSITERKYLKYFLILSIISLLNMLQGPLAPHWILNGLEMNNRIVAKFLALFNILIFFRVLYIKKIFNIKQRD